MWSEVSRWLKKNRKANRQAPRSTHHTRPTLEQLEDRLAPANTVCTFTPGTIQGVRGISDPFWSTRANWAPAPPDDSGTDSVVVSPPANGWPAGVADVGASIAALTLTAGGPLVVNSPITVGSGGTTVPGAPLTVNSQLQTVSIAAAGGTVINAGGELDITGSGVSAFGPVSSTTVAGTLKAQNSATVTLAGTGALSGTLGSGPGGDSTFTFTSTSSWAQTGSGTFLGGHFAINGGFGVGGTFNPNALNITLDNNGGTTGTPTAGAITGGGSMTLEGDFTWDGGTIGLSGGVLVDAAAALTATTGEAKGLGGVGMTNNSVSTVLRGTGGLTIAGGATFTNSSGIVTVSLPAISGAGTFVNNAFLKATLPDAPTTISTNFTNTTRNSEIQVTADDTLTLVGDTGSGGTCLLGGVLQLDGDLDIAATYAAAAGLTEDGGTGELAIGGTLSLPSGVTATLGGTTEVLDGGAISGAGQLTVSTGVLILDLGSAAVIGSYSEEGAGTLVVEWGGLTAFSSLTVTGNANLSGALEVDFVNGFQPAAGDSFTPLTYGSRTNRFDTITEPTNPPSHQLTPDYGPTGLTVTQN